MVVAEHVLLMVCGLACGTVSALVAIVPALLGLSDAERHPMKESTSMKRRARLIALLVTLSVAGVFAADWPGYLGPRRDGTSTEKGLLRTWPKEGPKVLWTVPLGIGFGGPAVSRGKVYLLDRDDKVGDTLRVYDFATGKELWNFAYDAPGSFEFPGSRTTPTVDGNIVYIAGPLGDLHAIDINTHKPVWHKNIWKDFGGGGAFIPFRAAGRSAGAAAWGSGGAPPAPPGGVRRRQDRRVRRRGRPALLQRPLVHGAERLRGHPAGSAVAGSPFGPDGFGGGSTTFPMWGITQNPLVYRSLVIVASQAPEAGVVAYDKLTGELKWKTASLGGTGFVSPSSSRSAVRTTW